MGELLNSFTYPRNALGADTSKSAQKVLEVIGRARSGKLQTVDGSIKDEPFNDMRAMLGVVAGPPAEPVVTELGRHFEALCARSEVGAWQWLLARSLWLYSTPNGTKAAAVSVAEKLGISFNFFDMIIRLSVCASSLPSRANVLYFDELLALLADDAKWGSPVRVLFDEVLDSRAPNRDDSPSAHRPLLGDLENEFGMGRDNANTVFVKAFGQTGLLQLVAAPGQPASGIRLDPAAYSSTVMARRLRFVLDNPRIWGAGGSM